MGVIKQMGFKFPEGSLELPDQVPLLLDRSQEEADEPARRALAGLLTKLAGEPVHLVVTNNSHTMITSKRDEQGVHARMHHMFLDADQKTLRALATYLTRTDRRAAKRIDAFIEMNGHRIRRTRLRKTPFKTAGTVHDLREIFEEENQNWFRGKVDAQITWARRTAPKRRRRSIRLGTYLDHESLIRIHPVLDQVWVPRFFVAYVVYHEMLHHVVPSKTAGGRNCHHTPEFRSLERAYPEYQRAIAWEKANLDRLLSSFTTSRLTFG